MQHNIEQFFIFSKAIEMSFQLIRKIRIYIEITILMFLLRLFCTESLRQTNLCETKKTRGKYMILPRFRGPTVHFDDSKRRCECSTPSATIYFYLEVQNQLYPTHFVGSFHTVKSFALIIRAAISHDFLYHLFQS